MRHVETDQSVPVPPMISQIDWKAVVCQFLNISSRMEDNAILTTLQSANDKMKEAERSAHMKPNSDIADAYQIIHRIRCAEESEEQLCLDVPWTVKNGPRKVHLRGSQMIEHLILHLERHKEVAFIVFKDYRCCGGDELGVQQATNSAETGADASDLLVKESVRIVSEAFGLALKELWSKAVGTLYHPKFQPSSEFSAPFIWWYCQKAPIEAAIPSLQQKQLNHVRLFQTYLDSSLGDVYDAVDFLTEQGKITPEYMPYLYVGVTIPS